MDAGADRRLAGRCDGADDGIGKPDPLRATQVWSAEATSAFQSAAPSVIASPAVGSVTYGQDVGSLPAVTLTRVGAR